MQHPSTNRPSFFPSPILPLILWSTHMKLHMDLDCYFVSAERTRYPFLKGKPVVIAKGSDKRIFSGEKKQGVLLGDTGAFNALLEFKNTYDTANIASIWKEMFTDPDGTIHGIVITKSYEAKAYGIQTGTPLKEALLMCPSLTVLPSDHLFYQHLSFKLKSFLETKIPLLEQYSIDEFFGDVSGWVEPSAVPAFIRALQAEVTKRFDLPLSIAASQSKWIAKLATDTVKPYGTTVIWPQEVEAFTNPLPIEDFPGIGRAITLRLKAHDAHTLKEAKALPRLFASYGKTGKQLYQKILGIDNEPVIPSRERKGIGISRNFPALEDREELKRRVVILAKYLSYTITKLSLLPTTFYMKLRYQYGVKSSQSITHDRLFSESYFRKLSLALFETLDCHRGYKIHYIGLSASNFVTKHNPKSFSVVEFEQDKKLHALTQGLAKIRDKHGVDMIGVGREMG